MGRIRSIVYRPSLIIIAVLTGIIVMQFRFARANEQLFGNVLSLLSDRYVEKLPVDSLLVKASHGLLDQIGDPYAQLYSPAEMAEYTSSHLGYYGGLGMLLEDRDGNTTVVQVYNNTPASDAGIISGDVVVAINGEPVTSWPLAKVTTLLRGPLGTHVTVTFAHGSERSTTEFKRAEVNIPAVPYDMMFGTTGYIPLTSFGETSAQEVGASLARLETQGATSLILDLRGNSGGLVDEAVEIADHFLKKGLVVVDQRERKDTIAYRTDDNGDAGGVPVIVLVDKFSASASEIVAGALQDHNRAAIVGERSYGKGLVQSVFRVSGGNILKFTTGKWFTPDGHTIQRPVEGDTISGVGGIKPDVAVSNDTLATNEKAFVTAIGDHRASFYLALTDVARELSKSADPRITLAARERVYTNLVARKAAVPKPVFDGAGAYVDYLLEAQTVRYAQGEAAARRVTMRRDAVLERALELLRTYATTESLLTAAKERG